MVRSTILFNKRITPSELAAIARANAISRTAKKSPLSPKSQVPKIKLNNGQEMPAMGLGTWQAKPGEVAQAVKDAIASGYRHIDCAYAYLNEKEVGAGIAAKINDGTVQRKDLFVSSKLWNTFHSADLVEPALRTTLKDLQLEYLDLFLIHWPTAFEAEEEIPEIHRDSRKYPRDSQGNIMFSDVDYVDTWKAMENLVQKGLVKSIGVCNFNAQQLERIMQNSDIVPAVNQIEIHPYLSQQKLVDFCKSCNIEVIAYSSLRSQDRQWEHEPSLLKDPALVEISFKYNKSVAQVILRWVMQRGLIAIPKSVNRVRISENLNIFDFYLTNEDMEIINSLNRNQRAHNFEIAVDHKNYPFKAEN